MTDLDIYQPAGGIGQYQAGIVMTPESAKALDEQVRACTKAVLREGTDYGIIPGTNGEKSLWRPGAQKLLQWFGLSFSCERVEVERDDDGRKHGITYRATVYRRLGDAAPTVVATCEGTADYDESKFYQSAEQVKARLRDQEHKWAAKDRRVPNADRWNSAKEYRADWNALMKRAQKRAIVGAVVDATAAGGIFTDREEDESPVPQDDGPSWYEQALEAALDFTDQKAGRKLFVEAAQAARDGLCTPRQANHIQNRITQRAGRLKNAAPVDVEDLARQAGGNDEPDGQEPPEASPRTTTRGKAAAGDDTRSQHRAQAPRTADEHGADPAPQAAGRAPSRDAQPLPPLPGEDEPPDPTRPAAPAATSTGTGSSTAPAADDPSEPDETDYDTPGTATNPQITAIWTVLSTVFKFAKDEKDQARAVCAHIAGHPLDSTKNMSRNEAKAVLDALANWREVAERHEEQPREFLIELLATAQKAGEVDD